MREPRWANGRLAHRPDPAALVSLQSRLTRRTLCAQCSAAFAGSAFNVSARASVPLWLIMFV
jgi:hypothetical protein